MGVFLDDDHEQEVNFGRFIVKMFESEVEFVFSKRGVSISYIITGLH